MNDKGSETIVADVYIFIQVCAQNIAGRVCFEFCEFCVLKLTHLYTLRDNPTCSPCITFGRYTYNISVSTVYARCTYVDMEIVKCNVLYIVCITYTIHTYRQQKSSNANVHRLSDYFFIILKNLCRTD